MDLASSTWLQRSGFSNLASADLAEAATSIAMRARREPSAVRAGLAGLADQADIIS
jgi:hypothetical protein